MSTITLIEGIDVCLLNPDSQAAMEPDAYVGQRCTIEGKRFEVVSNSMIDWTLRPLTLCEIFQERRKS